MTAHDNLYRVDPRLARILALGIDRDLPNHMEEWHAHLTKNQMTGAMLDIFSGLGWMSSARDPRVELIGPTAPASEQPDLLGLTAVRPTETLGPRPEVVVDADAPAESVDIEEPAAEPGDVALTGIMQRRAREDAEAAAVISEPEGKVRRRRNAETA